MGGKVTSLAGPKNITAFTYSWAQSLPLFDEISILFFSIYATRTLKTPGANKAIPGESKRSTSEVEICYSRKAKVLNRYVVVLKKLI